MVLFALKQLDLGLAKVLDLLWYTLQNRATEFQPAALFAEVGIVLE